MEKPAHQPSRRKFDNTDKACIKEKMNTTQTAEDKIDRDDWKWTNSLRPLNPRMNAKVTGRNFRPSQTEQKAVP